MTKILELLGTGTKTSEYSSRIFQIPAQAYPTDPDK